MAEGVCCECQHYKRQSCRVAEPIVMSSRKIRGYPAVNMSDTCEKWELASDLEQAELRGEQETEDNLRAQLAAVTAERDEANEAVRVHREHNIRLAADRDRLREALHRVMDQLEQDLKGAHAEIVKLQGGYPAKYTWPEWSPQANSVRWLARLREEFPSAALSHGGGNGQS